MKRPGLGSSLQVCLHDPMSRRLAVNRCHAREGHFVLLFSWNSMGRDRTDPSKAAGFQETLPLLILAKPLGDGGHKQRVRRAEEAGEPRMLSDDMRRLIDEQRLGYVATTCPDGTPNLSPKGTVVVWRHDHLAFADIASPTTVANLLHNPAIEINVVDPFERRGYRFKGTAVVLSEGQEFEEAVVFYRDRGTLAPIQSVVMVTVERALGLYSPSYASGSTEAEVRDRWERHYRGLMWSEPDGERNSRRDRPDPVWRRDPFVVDTDRARLPMGQLVTLLHDTHWAVDHPAERIQRAWEHSAVVAGLYREGVLVGCARVLTDFAAVAYLADVYVAPQNRGHGLGRWLVRCLLDHPDLVGLRWLLHSRDARHMYRALGFGTPGPAVMEQQPSSP